MGLILAILICTTNLIPLPAKDEVVADQNCQSVELYGPPKPIVCRKNPVPEAGPTGCECEQNPKLKGCENG